MESFRKSPLAIQGIRFGYDRPDNETLASLSSKYGPGREFNCFSISAIFRKPPEGFQGTVFRRYIELRKNLCHWSEKQIIRIRLLMRMLLFPFSLFGRIWRYLVRH
jgi:hypothetical protein